MKKFITLLCAVALTLGANAAISTKNLAVKKHAKDVSFVQQTTTRNAVAEAPSDTFNLQVLDYSSLYYNQSNDVFYVLHCSDHFQFRFDIYVDSSDVVSDSVYTTLSMESDFCYGIDTVARAYIEPYDSVMFKKVDNDKAITIDAKVWYGDSLFVLSYYFAKPSIARYDTIVENDLELDARDLEYYLEEEGMGYYSASSIKGFVSLEFLGVLEVTGTYNQSFVAGTILGSKIFSCSVIVAEDGDYYTVKGDFLTVSGVQYHIELSYVEPVPVGEAINLTFKGGVFTDKTADNGYWEVEATDSTKYGITLLFRAEEAEGDFKTEDIYARKYNMVINVKDTIIYLIHLAEISVEEMEDEVYVVEGNVVGVNMANDKDVLKFNLNITCGLSHYIDYDEEEYTWAFDFANGEVDDQYVATYGVIIVSGENATVSASVNLEFVGEEAPEAGEYEISAEEEDGIFTAGSFDEGYLLGSYIVTSDYKHIWFLVSGTITVNEDGSMTIDAVNSYGISVTGTIYMAVTPIDNINAADKKADKIFRNGQLILKSNNREYNALGQEL